ncbi:MAG: flagellar basal body P-ring formation chaperone FlgA [Vicinamibacterales bacterium]
MVLATLLTVALAAPPAIAPVSLDEASVVAITAAVRQRLGDSAEVSIAATSRLDAPAVPPADAVLDPTAAPGRPSRVVFRAVDPRTGALVPVGGATVVLDIAVDHLHVARAVRRGATVGAADLAPARHPMARGPLRPYPLPEDVVDGRATRDLAAGACLTAGVVAPQPAVRPGDPVTGVLRVDAVEARAELVAVDSGRIGARIRVMNADSRRTFRARIISRTLVEIEP